MASPADALVVNASVAAKWQLGDVAARWGLIRLSVELGKLAVQKFLSLGVRVVDDDELIVNAYDLVHRYGCAVYDALYLALSQRLRIPLLIADRRLHQR